MKELDEKLTRMPLEEAAKLMSQPSDPITVERLQALVARGAPLNEDGTLNLFQWVAWLFTQNMKP